MEPPGGVARLGVIEALLNAETWFRRDRAAFEVLERELLPALTAARGGPVRIWSAGAGSGQEAYSLAIAALEAGARVEVLATDLSRQAIEKALSGLYSSFEIQRGLSARTMLRWFEQVDDHWRARPELRAAVTFKRANLLDAPADEGRFDIIFCRHVLGDMTPERRPRLLDGLERGLVDDGCLFLGADERPDGDSVAFRPVAGRRGLYVKSPSAYRRAA
ncbi:protein-glutamate O-methyltransferase CheR [Brevundimonas sp. LF-1]|uniref:CheR family methyltransferase n=1 Tax=Brevundimonas sp. LF-1 TaxID=3126100 RepID=UPI0030E508F3